MGPETRSREAAESSEPHFLQAGRGEAESISCCALTAGETSSPSAPSDGRPGAKGQLRAGRGRAGARRRGRALRLPPQPCAPPGLQSHKRPPDALPFTVAPSCGTHLPPPPPPPARRGAHLQRLKKHFPCPILIAVTLIGLSTRNLLKHQKLPV